jgi:large subunit ribosomal protein L25
MEQLELEAKGRVIQGKKVEQLRRQGITPLHLFGHGQESLALQSETIPLQKVLAHAGQTRLINLKLDEGSRAIPVLVREVQKHPITGKLLHVDLYQVRMGEKLEVEVPIAFIGEAPALRIKENMLVHELDTLSIETLPDRIPSRIEVDLTSLKERDQAIRIKDINLGKDITVLGNPEQVVVKVAVQTEEKVEVKPTVEKVAEEGAEEAKAAEESPSAQEKTR